MRTLLTPGTLELVLARIQALDPGDKALWGRMNAGQMLCHLCDAARFAVGQQPIPAIPTGIPPKLMKWLALEVPLRWKRNYPAPAAIDQLQGGTPPAEFEHDRAALLELTRQLTAASLEGRMHPYFGSMTRQEWMRWAWLHADHHLRQFGR